MIQTIRAHRLFSLVSERAAAERITQMKIPIRRIPEFADYSLRLLELMSLTALIRMIGAKRIFEFGTFLGNTTLHMALNSPEDARIWTLDADDETLARIGLLDLYSWRTRFPLEFVGTSVENKVAILRADSHTYEPGPLTGLMDLVLIDGDHSGEGVTHDTVSAKMLLRSSGNACIAWHDYLNPGCRENTAFLDELSKTFPLFHIQDTMLVVHLRLNGTYPLL